MKIEVGAKTDVGLVRDHNEDSFCVNLKNRVFIVADGMGGHAAGEVASNQLKDYIEEYVIQRNDTNADTIDHHLQEAVKRANRHIHDLGIEDPGKRGMGTTATILLLTEDHYHIAQVGDSRAYLLRNGELTQLTRDHSKVFQLYEHGLITKDEIEDHPYSNIITRSIGNRPTVEADIYRDGVHEGDRFLLCSDGLTGEVKDRAIAEVLLEHQAPQDCCDELVRRALQNGGRDNVTVLVVDVIARAGKMRQTVPISKKDVERILAAKMKQKDGDNRGRAAGDGYAGNGTSRDHAAGDLAGSTSENPDGSPRSGHEDRPAKSGPPASEEGSPEGRKLEPEGPRGYRPAQSRDDEPADRSSGAAGLALKRTAAALVVLAAILAAWFLVVRKNTCPVLIETIPPGAELYVDGAYLGKTPFRDVLPEGLHRLTAAMNGFEKQHFVIRIDADDTALKRKSIVLVPRNDHEN